MLKVIEPHSHEFYQSKIDTLSGLFKVYQNIELSPEEEAKATFIIAEDETFGAYGGALLYNKKVCVLDDKLKKIISTLHPNKQKVWTVHLCLCVEEEPFSSVGGSELLQNFYPSLLKKFISFGKNEEIDFLVLSLRPIEYRQSKSYGWSYLLETQPNESSDGLFHGLLALKSARLTAFKKVKHRIYPLTQDRVNYL